MAPCLQQTFFIIHLGNRVTDRPGVPCGVAARRAAYWRLRAAAPAAPFDDALPPGEGGIAKLDIVTSEPLATDPRRQGSRVAPFWQAAGLSTGFPIPTGYAEGGGRSVDSGSGRGYDFYGRPSPLRVPRHRSGAPLPRNDAAPLQRRDRPGSGAATPLRPVFRTSPFLAEYHRQRAQTPTTRILFLDEGGEFRGVLGAALLRAMLAKLQQRLDVSVDCASIGAPERGAPDRRLRRIAAELGLPLARTLEEQRRGGSRRFDEVADAVSYDLILVMDRFDYQEVLKEVAVLDAINPGGYYAGRVRRLGPFGMAAPSAAPADVAEDVSDPLYGLHPSEEAEAAAVRAAARELAFACRGLAAFLQALQARRGRGVTLREALAQALQCPLLAGGMVPHRDLLALGPRHPATQDNGMPVDDYFTVRVVQGLRRVVRRASRPRGFWADAANVEADLRAWMRARQLERLPTQRELRHSGASSLAAAIDVHGGMAAFARRLGVGMAARRPNGHWDDFQELERALRPYLTPAPAHAAAAGQASGGRCSGSTSNGGAGSGHGRIPAPGGTRLQLPTHATLLAAGRADLVCAIRQQGGSAAVAARLGVGVRKGAGWTEGELLQELRTIAAAGGGRAHSVPSRAGLLKAGRADLVAAVQKLGGFPYFRQLASAAAPRAPVIEAVGCRVLEFVRGSPCPGRLPTRQELLSGGRGDLWTAVQRAGGLRRLAEHLGLPHLETRGRRKRGEAGRAGPGGGSGDDGGGAPSADPDPNPREELDMMDAYEEVVFV